MTTHVMIDLETLSTSPNAEVLSLGAFNMSAPRRRDSQFFCKFLPNGGDISRETVDWWMSQSREAWDLSTFPGGKYEARHGLTEFRDWLMGQPSVNHLNDIRLWGNPERFDNRILRGLAARAQIDVLPSEWNDRCYRTVTKLAPHIKRKQLGTHHHALDDAKSQARHLAQVLKHLGKTLDEVS